LDVVLNNSYFLAVTVKNNKLKKSVEHIRSLEEKLQNAFNENAKLKVKQKEDEKLWKGLESKFSSTKTLCDQLTETLQQLAGLVQDGMKVQSLPLIFVFYFSLFFLFNLLILFFVCVLS
jgi:hypothetical protein